MQLLGCPAQPQGWFLERPGNMEPPAGIAQVAFEFADHTGHGVGEERGAVAGVVAVDGAITPARAVWTRSSALVLRLSRNRLASRSARPR
jgi:hypothetical protein